MAPMLTVLQNDPKLQGAAESIVEGAIREAKNLLNAEDASRFVEVLEARVSPCVKKDG